MSDKISVQLSKTKQDKYNTASKCSPLCGHEVIYNTELSICKRGAFGFLLLDWEEAMELYLKLKRLVDGGLL